MAGTFPKAVWPGKRRQKYYEVKHFPFSNQASLLMKLIPNGRKTKLADYQGGLFAYKRVIGFKRPNGKFENGAINYGTSFVASTGEVFWAGTRTDAQRLDLIIQPLRVAQQ